MAYLKNSQCAYNCKLNLNEPCTIIISKKISFQTLLKSGSSIWYDQVNCSRFSVNNIKMSSVHKSWYKQKELVKVIIRRAEQMSPLIFDKEWRQNSKELNHLKFYMLKAVF